MLTIKVDKHFSRPSRRKRQSSNVLIQITSLVNVEDTQFVVVKLKIELSHVLIVTPLRRWHFDNNIGNIFDSCVSECSGMISSFISTFSSSI